MDTSDDAIIGRRDLSLLMSAQGLDLSKDKAVYLGRKHDIKPIDPVELLMIQNYIEKSNDQPERPISVVKAWSVRRQKDEQMYRKGKYHLKSSMLLWHGTKNHNIESILTNGFRNRSKDHWMNGRDFGSALYFADRVNKSVWFCGSGHHITSPVQFLFLCQVCTGTMKELTSLKPHYRTPNGFDSVKGVGKYQPDPSDLAFWNDMNTLIPWGRTQFKPEVVGHTFDRYNEYCVYTKNRVLIKYLVAFQ